MIGRLEPGPKLRFATPGSFSSASASVGRGSEISSNESSVEIALNASKAVVCPPAVAVTVNSSWTVDKRSVKLAVTSASDVTVTLWRAALRCSRCAMISCEPGGTLVIS